MVQELCALSASWHSHCKALVKQLLNRSHESSAMEHLMAEGLSEMQNYVLKLRYHLVPCLMPGGT